MTRHRFELLACTAFGVSLGVLFGQSSTWVATAFSFAGIGFAWFALMPWRPTSPTEAKRAIGDTTRIVRKEE